MSDLPEAHFGSSAQPLVDWRNVPDTDPDDEQIATPKDVVMMLGFDPADVEHDRLDAALDTLSNVSERIDALAKARQRQT